MILSNCLFLPRRHGEQKNLFLRDSVPPWQKKEEVIPGQFLKAALKEGSASLYNVSY